MFWKSFLPRSIKVRLTVFTLAIFVLSSWLIVFFASRVLQIDMQKMMSSQQLSSASIIAEQVNEDLTSRLEALGRYTTGRMDPGMVGDPAAMQTRLEGSPVLASLFNAGIFVTGLEGTAIASVPVSVGRVGVNYMERDSIAAALKEGKPTISRPVIGKLARTPLITMAVPIRDTQGKVIGALVGVTDLGRPNFLDHVTQTQYGETGGYMFIAPKLRLIVTASKKSRIMETLPPPGVIPAMDRFLQGYEGSTVFVNRFGIESLTSVKRIPVADWFVAIDLPTKEAFAPIRALQHRLLLGTILLTLVLGGAIWWMTSRTMRQQLLPIFTATQRLDNMASSQLAPQPLLITSKDEFGELFGAFNRLLAAKAQAEQTLRESEESYRRQFTDNTAIMLMIDPNNGRILEANTAAATFYGYSGEQLRALRIADINTLPPDRLQAALDSAGANQSERFVFQHRLADGSLRDVEVSASLIQLGNHPVLHSIIHDITERKQAEKGLLETNELLTIFVRQSPIYTYIKEVTPTESRILQASENFEQMIGIKGSDMVGKTMAEVFSADLAAKTLVDDLAVVAGGKTLEVEEELNGRSYSTLKFPIVQHGKTLLAGFTIDITERKHLEKTSRFLAQAEWLTTGEDFFVALGRFLAQHLAMDYVCIDRLLGEGLAAKTLAIWFDGHAEDNVEYALKDTPCGDVVGRTICCFPDGVRHQFPQDQVLQDMGAESYLGTTLWGSGGQPIGLIALIDRRPITTPRLMEATLALVSVRAAGELERRDAEAKLNESLAFTHELIASMQDGFSVLDRLGVQLDVNPSFCRMTGFSREELVGVGAPYPYWPPEELDTIQAALLETIKGIATTFELIFMRKNGERFPVLVSPATIKDSQGRTSLFSATVKDITDRKRAETSLRRHAQLAEAMLQLPRIAEELDEQVFMQRSLALAENLTGSLVSFMHFVNDDEDTIELAAWSQRTVTNYCRSEFNRHYPVSRAGIWADAVRQRAAVVCNDYATYPGKKGLPEGHAELVRFVSVPVIENGKVVMLTGVGNSATNYDVFDLESVQQLSNDVWHIVQRRRNQQALQLTRFSVENASDAMFWIRPDASIADVNGAACRSLGYTREELLGLRVPDVDAHYDTEKWPDHFDELRQRGSMVFESEQIRRNGQRFSVEIVANYVKFGGEERNCAFVRDITERKQAEAEKANLQAQLQQSQKMESLGTLAGGVAHDMNNVLGAILGLASAHIGTQPYGSPLHQSLDTICKATERGGKMVKSLLSFSRQSPAESHKLDMNAILREQVSLLERTTLAKVRLQINLEAELRPILGDASALAHAFMNLCVNAVDAMPENGTLTLHTHNVDNDWIEVVVEDNGTGMPKEVLEKAMEPFYTTKEIGKGTGLGLSMVFSTVKAHRGQMAIESEPGQGTRVRLRFPACEAEATVQAAAPTVTEATLIPHGTLKVLLIDDDDLIRSSVQMILEVLGHTAVKTAESGEEALALLEAGFEPDLVILDMNMPGLGGIGTLPRLRVLRPEVPVLLATGRVDQTALTLASVHPGVTLLAKPFGLRELQKHLESIGLG